MEPCFFKNLGPIGVNKIKEQIQCNLHNLNEEVVFLELTNLRNLKKGGISFLNDSEVFNGNEYSEGAIICTNSIRNKLNDNI